MAAAITEDPVVRSAARWFWWIAGLSVVNFVLFHAGSNTSFVIGLGLTTLTSELFAEQVVMAGVLAALVIGFYGLVGWFAQQERAWAFYLGLVVYVLDAAIYALAQDWMPVAFHAFAIYCIGKGVLQLRGRAQPAPAA